MNDGSNPIVRPPWPDELARTWKFLGQTRFTGRVHPRIAVIGAPERIVAASALEIQKNGGGRLHLFLRTRFCNRELTDRLLREAEEIAEKEGIKQLALVLPEAAPWRPFLEGAGYVHQRTDEWWEILRSDRVDKRFAIAERLVRSQKMSENFTVHSLSSNDYPAVQAIVREHGLANLDRLGNERMLNAASAYHSPERSLIVRWKNEIAGIYLVKDLRDGVFVHVRAVSKNHLDKSGAINAHFLARWLGAELRGVNRGVFSAQPTVEKETIAMAKRFGGQRIGSYCQYLKHL